MTPLEEACLSPFYQINIGQGAKPPPFLERFREFVGWQPDWSPELRLGQLLCSAVVHGALLDERAWPAWSIQLRKARCEGELLWVDMRLPNPRRKTGDSSRQWFADPITRLLLRRWLDDRTRLPTSDARHCLLLFLREISRNPGLDRTAVGDLITFATLHWRLRMPGLLVAQALGELGTTALSPDDFKSLRRFANAAEGKEKISEPWKPSGLVGRFLKRDLPEARIFRHADVLTRLGDHSADQLKSTCVGWLSEAAEDLRIARRILITWCQTLLEVNRLPHSHRGVALSTVTEKLAAILEGVFAGSLPRHAFELSASSLEAKLQLALTRETTATAQTSMKEAVSAFLTCQALKPSKPEIWPVDRQIPPIIIGPQIKSIPQETSQYSVSAKLVSAQQYEKAVEVSYETSPSGELALIIMLGFRTGLRIWEIRGLITSDFVIREDHFELHLDHNRFRRLKSRGSRRIIPLSLLLTENEQEALKSWVISRPKPASRRTRAVLCFSPAGSRSLHSECSYQAQISAIFKKIGCSGINYSHLRHSFSSYLLLQLLLPEPDSEFLIPRAFRASVTWKQRAILHNALLGQGRSGQSAAHAVSMMMGHTGIPRTLESYQHLLDLAVALYTNRSIVQVPLADSVRNSLEPHSVPRRPRNSGIETIHLRRSFRNLSDIERPDELHRPIDTRPPMKAERGQRFWPTVKTTPVGPETVEESYRPNWRQMHQLITIDDVDADRLAAKLSLEIEDVRQWRASYKSVMASTFAEGAKPNGLTIPKGAIAEALIRQMWHRMPRVASASNLKLLEEYLTNFNPKDYMGRMESIEKAKSLARLFSDLGFDCEHIGVANGSNRKISEYKQNSEKTEFFEYRKKKLYRVPIDTCESYATADKRPAVWIYYVKYKEDELGWTFSRRHRLDPLHNRKDDLVRSAGKQLSPRREAWAAYRDNRRAKDEKRGTKGRSVYALGNEAYRFCLLMMAIYYNVVFEARYKQSAHAPDARLAKGQAQKYKRPAA